MRQNTLAIWLVGFLFAPTQVFAQIEEVIVTAQKRAESIQDVPISMRALTGNDITAFDIQTTDQLTEFLPNVNVITGEGDGHLNFFIRGVGDQNFHLNSVGAVGIYLDDIALNNVVSTQFALFDVERIEVLRGPQNTLFGKNTTGGAITFITRKPELDAGLNGHLDMTYGSLDRIDVEAAFGMPLGPTAAVRFAAKTQNRGAWIENLTNGNSIGEKEAHAGRVSVLWQPFDAMEISGNAHIGVNRGGNHPYTIAGTTDPAMPINVAAFPLDSTPNRCAQWPPADTINSLLNNPVCSDIGGETPAPHGKSKASDPNLRNDVDTWGAVIKVDWEFDFAILTSISAYEKAEKRYNEDTEDGPDVHFAFAQEADMDQWSQEFRLTSNADQRFRWILGIYYFFEESLDTTVVRRTHPFFPSDAPVGTPVFFPSTIFFQDDTELSIYGQGEWDFNDQLTVTVGLRGSWQEKEAWNLAQTPNLSAMLDQFMFPLIGAPLSGLPYTHSFDEGIFPGKNFIQTGLLPEDVVAKTRLGENWRNWGGKAAVDYRWTDDVLLYASASRGFKGGGFSVAALQAILGQAARSVEPEILVTYEGGIKSDWETALGAFQFNVSVFLNNWKNQQIFSLIQDPVAGVLPLLINIPETQTYGAEIEAFWVPADGWIIQAGLGLLDSEVQDATDLPTISEGNMLPAAPEVSFTGLVRKEWQIGNGTLSLMTNFAYTDEQTFDIENKPQITVDSYFLLNARGAYSFGPDERYTIAVSGENLTDELYCRTGLDLTGGVGEINGCTTNDDGPFFAVRASVNFE